jgi:isopenicillin-N epimerase
MLAVPVVESYGHALARLWPLQPSIRHLNHGAFGATPKAVLAECVRWQRRIERNPSRFMNEELSPGLRRSAAALAAFLGTDAAQLALTENTTSAVNAVMRGLSWRRGDGILIADATYTAVRNTAAYVAAQSGLEVRTVGMPMPVRDENQVVSAWRRALFPGVRLAVLDHITSPTGLVLPVAKIAAMLKRRGIRVLVDGAHAPGQVPFAIGTLGADWYAGTCHKWLFAARGTAFLWSAPESAGELHPAVISNRFGEGFPLEFDWIGTRDYAAWMALPQAIAFHAALGGSALAGRNRRVALAAGRRLAGALGTVLQAPPEMLAALVALPLPAPLADAPAERLTETLRRRHRIEVPVLRHLGRNWVRFSIQAYNEMADVDALAEALGSLRRPGEPVRRPAMAANKGKDVIAKVRGRTRTMTTGAPHRTATPRKGNG